MRFETSVYSLEFDYQSKRPAPIGSLHCELDRAFSSTPNDPQSPSPTPSQPTTKTIK